MKESGEYRDRSRLVRLIGGILLLAGLFAAFIGPLEIYTFYLFSEGGRFHYDGFGFGSLMFGNIVIQVLGYYGIAFLLIPLGYGHLTFRRWSRRIALTLLWDWLILGLPLSFVLLLMLLTSKDLPVSSLPFLVVAFLLLYPVLPVLLILFYRSRHVQWTFEHRGAESDWTGQIPQPVLVLGSLMILFAIALHVPTLFNGVFPLFGTFLFEIRGILLADLSIMLLAFLTWGVFRRRQWAWWGSLVYLGLMTLSSTITFLAVSPSEIITRMRFAGLEMDALQNVPIQGLHLVLLIVSPVFITMILLACSRRHFVKENVTSQACQRELF